MSKLRLERHGITQYDEIFYNLSLEELFKHETAATTPENERGTVTASGAIAIDTGKYTGRSPKDKYVVNEETSHDKIWWGIGPVAPTTNNSDNQQISEETWYYLKDLCLNRLNGKKLYVMDAFCGANPESRIRVRLVTEIAWKAHFFRNMFIRPTEEELNGFVPDWTILDGCKISCPQPHRHNLRTDVFIAFNMMERMTLIGGTWYGGEIKKGVFSVMNYFLPLKGIGSFHCSANMGKDGDTALFFGLSGTGKTTLSTDPKRLLIGDDEHGWDYDGVFNFEGGCYAKCINLSPKNEPDIYRAIRRDALLENVVIDDKGVPDYNSDKKTENTRASYPIHHIDNIVRPFSRGGHPSKIIFLTCDAYGVLPPVAKLTRDQAMYHFLSGYTARVAGTELGVTEPKATFSACFGQAFLLLHPTRYAKILGDKIDKHGSSAYLVNTGWVRGKCGVGSRMDLPSTRKIIDAVLDGSLDKAEFETMPLFNFKIPKSVNGVDSTILNPRNAWADKSEYDKSYRKLAEMFVTHFRNFTDTENGRALVDAGPQLEIAE
ncbi:MAG: phosphoenolpyruvate carboxykinase (ATP) [Candidatus Omnitrophica bacterium]|nr:phosphoenolpyruvate carboxykinase (ATP) [Candidatus Omnitrophota bacterium]